VIKWVLRRAIDLAATVVVGGVALAAPAVAHASARPAAPTVYTMTPERIAASTAALVGLVGAVTGGLVVATAAGGIGTGNRLGGRRRHDGGARHGPRRANSGQLPPRRLISRGIVKRWGPCAL